VATHFFQDFLVSWPNPGLKSNGKLIRILENLVSNPDRILKFRGYTLLSGNCCFLRKKGRILTGSLSDLLRICHRNIKDFP
jgi:hypothetical protein